MRTKLCFSAAALLLVGCASTPKINYFTLAMESSGKAQPTVNLQVERLRTTEALGRSQILISKSPTEIEYYASDHWAGSVAELVQQKLSVEFGPPVEGKRKLSISGIVFAFGQVDVAGGAEGRVKLHIEVRDPEKRRFEKPLLEKTYEVSRAASKSGSAAVVVALSQGVEQIAAEIAADASSL
jgi:uncharacterized lipoprotein YmbA